MAPVKPLLQVISLRDCTSIGSSGINMATFFNSVDDGWGQVTYEMLNYNYESQSNIPIMVYYYNNL